MFLCFHCSRWWVWLCADHSTLCLCLQLASLTSHLSPTLDGLFSVSPGVAHRHLKCNKSQTELLLFFSPPSNMLLFLVSISLNNISIHPVTDLKSQELSLIPFFSSPSSNSPASPVGLYIQNVPQNQQLPTISTKTLVLATGHFTDGCSGTLGDILNSFLTNIRKHYMFHRPICYNGT